MSMSINRFSICILISNIKELYQNEYTRIYSPYQERRTDVQILAFYI